VREKEWASDGEQKDIEEAVGEVDGINNKYHGIGDVAMCEGVIPRN
jgi:hypothetical protein